MDQGKCFQPRQADRWGGSHAATLLVDGPTRKQSADGIPRGSPSRSARQPAPPPGSYLPVSSPRAASKMQRLLDKRKQSGSAFVASTQSMGLCSSASSTASASWSEEMPSPLLFPTNKPSSRADATILNRWITSALDRYAAKMAGGLGETPSLLHAVDELVPLLSVGLHELTRQVSQQCAERGVVLEKIWRSYVELFDKSLAETRGLMAYHSGRTQRVTDALQRTNDELSEVKCKKPREIEKLSKTFTRKFSQRQAELDKLLKSIQEDNDHLRQLLDKHSQCTKSWFPNFTKYKDSDYQFIMKTARPELPSNTTPEARIAADFKRIISVMPDAARRKLGYFISSLLGLRPTELVQETDVDILAEWKEHNAGTIKKLEQRVEELRCKKDSREQAEKPEGTLTCEA